MELGNLVDGFTTAESEDCLTLNIWTRGDSKNKPIMVWIFGGGFVCGSSSEPTYNASNFVSAHDVVIVTLNYRLNVFGFMNLANVDSSLEDSGYLGLKDQLAALKWIKENIGEFGGNPDNITVFGESAGSISTFFLTIAPTAKNLFQKVIPQSGAVVFYKNPEDSAQVTESFMKFCGDSVAFTAVGIFGCFSRARPVVYFQRPVSRTESKSNACKCNSSVMGGICGDWQPE